MRNACGLASIEMIYKYWKLSGKEQKEIGVEVLERFSKAKRYVDSDILKAKPTNLRIYPGTGTSTIHGFLKEYGAVDNFKMKQLPKDLKIALKVRGGNDDQIEKLHCQDSAVVATPECLMNCRLSIVLFFVWNYARCYLSGSTNSPLSFKFASIDTP